MPQHNFSRRLTTIFSVEIAHFRTDITACLALLDQELADRLFHCNNQLSLQRRRTKMNIKGLRSQMRATGVKWTHAPNLSE
jgi:hypothetical protein